MVGTVSLGRASFRVGIPFITGDDFSVLVSAQVGPSMKDSVQSSVLKTTTISSSRKVSGPGQFWQFVLYAKNSGDCKFKTNSILMGNLLKTKDANEPPCCLLNHFQDVDQAHGGCIGGPSMCQKTSLR